LHATITCSEKHFLNARDFSAIIGSVQAGLPAHSLCAVTWRYDVFSRRFADGNSANVRAVQGAGLIASPGGLSGFLRFYEDNADFRSGFQVIISAGRPLPKSLSERVRARLCSNLIFYYGTTETSTVSSAPAHALTGVAGAAGYIAPDVSVRVVDDNGTIFEPGREGSVLVRTPVSVHGYFEELAETETPFRDGYFDTGDIGYVTPEKMLVITGRKKEILNLGGDKVSPRLIEETLTDHDGVREALAFSVPSELGVDEVWALVVPTDSLEEEALQKHCGKSSLRRKFRFASSTWPNCPALRTARSIAVDWTQWCRGWRARAGERTGGGLLRAHGPGCYWALPTLK
jgi:acyl-CoA synthetase (AMP-forming)/AMP-acid ligase II